MGARSSGLLLGIAVGLSALTLAACGGDSDDESSAKETVESFFQAAADGDGDAVCELIVSDRKADCEEANVDPDPEQLESARATRDSLNITKVEIDGDEATVTATAADEEGGEEEEGSLTLTKEDGEWKISNIGD